MNNEDSLTPDQAQMVGFVIRIFVNRALKMIHDFRSWAKRLNWIQLVIWAIHECSISSWVFDCVNVFLFLFFRSYGERKALADYCLRWNQFSGGGVRCEFWRLLRNVIGTCLVRKSFICSRFCSPCSRSFFFFRRRTGCGGSGIAVSAVDGMVAFRASQLVSFFQFSVMCTPTRLHSWT